jgi:hypothetical protein
MQPEPEKYQKLLAAVKTLDTYSERTSSPIASPLSPKKEVRLRIRKCIPQTRRRYFAIIVICRLPTLDNLGFVLTILLLYQLHEIVATMPKALKLAISKAADDIAQSASQESFEQEYNRQVCNTYAVGNRELSSSEMRADFE